MLRQAAAGAARLPELQKKEAFASTGRSERGVFRDHLVPGLLGEELYVGLRVGPGSESHGEERSVAKVSWAGLTSALFRWSCV